MIPLAWPANRQGRLVADIINNAERVLHETKNGATMVVFSGDLDKALASMFIASGTEAIRKEVTIFFTFWDLSVLKNKKLKNMA